MNYEFTPQDQSYAPEPPEFMAGNPELLAAWQRGVERGEVMMDPTRADERQLPLPRMRPVNESVSAEQAQDEAPYTLDSRYIDGALFLCAVAPNGDILVKELASEAGNSHNWDLLAKRAEAVLAKKSKV